MALCKRQTTRCFANNAGGRGGDNLTTIGARQNPDRNVKSPVPALHPPAHHFPKDSPGRTRPQTPGQPESGCPLAPITRPRLRGKDPRAAACPPTHLRAPMFLFFLVLRRLEPDLRRRHHPRPHSCPAHSLPEMLPPGLFSPPEFPAPQYGVTSACASCSSARRESWSRERARSVSEAGARPVDDNKFVAQCRSLSGLSRQPSGSRTYCLRTDGALRELPAWGARFFSAPSPRRA